MKLVWTGDVSASHSLSIMARPVVAKLSEVYDVTIKEISGYPDNPIQDKYTKTINQLKSKPLHINPDIEVRSNYPLLSYPPDHQGKIIFWQPWELDYIPTQWIDCFNSYATAVLGICPYNVEVYQKSLRGPIIDYISPPIHEVYFQDYDTKPDPTCTTILYDAGSSWRKGPDLMLGLMKRFAGHTNVKFIWKDTNIYRNNMFPEIDKLNTNCAYYLRNFTFEEMFKLYAQADIVVYPTRAEGFGYCPAQGLVMGKNVVSPNHTGMDYLKSNNAYIVDCEAVEVNPDYILAPQYGYTFDQPVHVGEPYQDHLYAQVIQAMAGKQPKKDRDYLRKFMSGYMDEFIANKWLRFLEEII